MRTEDIKAFAVEIHAAIGYSHICGRLDRYEVEDWRDQDKIEENWAHAVAKSFVAGRGLTLDETEFDTLSSEVRRLDLAHYDAIRVYYEDEGEEGDFEEAGEEDENDEDEGVTSPSIAA